MTVFKRLVIAFLCLSAFPASAGPRLDAIKARGVLNCGVAVAEPGMSRADRGNYTGFEPDLCRAVAIAIFGTPKIAFKPVTTVQTFLQSNDIDIVFRGLTSSFRREAGTDIRFGPIYLYDGQTFLVRSNGARTIAQLSRRPICVSSDMFADFMPALQRYFHARNLVLNAKSVQTRAEAERLFFAGSCDAVTADASELASAVIAHGGGPGAFSIFTDQITKEPLAPLLRKGDDQFFDIVRWSLYALVAAEELGISRSSADSARAAADPDIQAFFALPPASSGLAPSWSHAIVKQLGNYGELFERHLGAGTAARLPRGMNRLGTQGGLLYAPPVR